MDKGRLSLTGRQLKSLAEKFGDDEFVEIAALTRDREEKGPFPTCVVFVNGMSSQVVMRGDGEVINRLELEHE